MQGGIFEDALTAAHNSTYLWGTYKPNLYFSMKTRESQPLNFGVGWFNYTIGFDEQQGRQGVHTNVQTECRHKGENVKFKFLYHNGKDYALEEITDEGLNVKLTIEMMKTSYDSMEEQSWQVKIRSQFLDKSSELVPNVEAFVFMTTDRKSGIFNASKESSGLKLRHSKSSESGGKKSLKWEKFAEEFSIYNPDHKEKSFIGVALQNTWNINQIMDKLIKMNVGDLPSTFADGHMENSNIFIYKWKPQKDGNEVLVTFRKSIKPEPFTNSFKDFDTKAIYLQNQFIDEFNSKFNPSPSDQTFSIQVLSQLISGLGYFHGSIRTAITVGAKVVKTDPAPLFTCTPSRTQFPRGFLWDEGFHQLVLSQWNPMLTIDVVWHWMKTIQWNGWIPREQIRGDEAEAYVPPEFVVQNQDVANPPSLLLVYESLLNRYENNEFKDEATKKAISAFFSTTFDFLELWFNWFKKSQENFDVPFTFQWKGRTRDHNFPSGLDDYPRALQPSKREIHLDLQSWMATLTSTLQRLSTFLDLSPRTIRQYQNYTQKTISAMNTRLFNPTTELFADYLGFQWKLIENEHGELVPPYVWRRDGRCGKGAKNHLGLEAKCDAIDGENLCCKQGSCKFLPDCQCKNCNATMSFKDDPEMRKENQFNYHQGIVNLFPIMFGLIDPTDIDKLQPTLNFLFDTEKMMSPYGVRSLSKKDVLFHKDEDYWRGNIWINVNYLVYRGLQQYYSSGEHNIQINGLSLEEHIKMFRDSLVENVKKEFFSSGWLWEQYSEEKGEGRRGHPFSGWTSLVLLIMSDKY